MSKIEWTGKTWNPVSGCTKISQGCKNCYAESMANRLQKMGTKGYENGFKLTVQPDRLNDPLKWKKPQTIFVCSMADLFHEDVSFGYIDSVMQVIEQCPQHTFQILTKRAKNMREFFESRTAPKNVWLGVTCENQETADERIPHLLNIKASVRFLSIEPMLGAIDLTMCQDQNYPHVHHNYLSATGNFGKIINWVIVGGESGHKARPMNPAWARSIRDQCLAENVPFFFKQWGEWVTSDQDADFAKVSLSTDQTIIDNTGAVPKAVYKVGKKRAGRLLDGVLHDAIPKVGL